MALVAPADNHCASDRGRSRSFDLCLGSLVWFAGLLTGLLVHVPSENRIIRGLSDSYDGCFARRLLANRARLWILCARSSDSFYQSTAGQYLTCASAKTIGMDSFNNRRPDFRPGDARKLASLRALLESSADRPKRSNISQIIGFLSVHAANTSDN